MHAVRYASMVADLHHDSAVSSLPHGRLSITLRLDLLVNYFDPIPHCTLLSELWICRTTYLDMYTCKHSKLQVQDYFTVSAELLCSLVCDALPHC
jgi:hypothetical protein